MESISGNNLAAIENKHDHGAILEELKEIRQDLKEIMEVTKDDMKSQYKEFNDTIKELREELQNQKICLAKTNHMAEGSRKAIYMVIGPSLFVAVSAMAKAMGFI